MSTRKKITDHIELLSDQEDNERAKVRTSTEGLIQPRSETNPLLSQQTPKHCCLEAVLLHWFTRGPKTYSYTTGIVGFVLMVGAGQFVFANWHLMKEEGDRDNCYYNDFCYRVSDWHDIPLNLMISNLVYMIHGLILAGSVFYMEAKRLHEIGKSDTRQFPPNQAFSIGYAFAWALFFEGCFSLVYHLCPSKLTFQFDTAFMFVIAGLTVILLYNGIEMKECSGDGNAVKSPVGAGNFFLYFLVPLYIFNYLGTLRHSETGLPLLLETIFFSFLAWWWVIITFWTGSKLGVVCSIEYFKKEPCKIFWFVLGVVAPVICFFGSISNLPQAFLFACIAESVIASLGRGFCRDIKLKCSCLGTCFCRDITFKCSCIDTGMDRDIKFRCSCKGTNSSQGRKCKCSCLSFFQILYVVLMGVLWGLALYYFLGKQVTDKVETPEKSRNLNHECTWLGFFDYHDIWHFLSSHGLLMMVYFVMFMSSA
ncbi:SID1 transmembrane family member 2-like [Oculina patagonica]